MSMMKIEYGLIRTKIAEQYVRHDDFSHLKRLRQGNIPAQFTLLFTLYTQEDLKQFDFFWGFVIFYWST